MQVNNSHNAILIINRLKLILEIDKDAALADYLGVKANTISTWKSRNTIDYNLLIAKCDMFDLNFILKGDTEKLHSKQINSDVKTPRTCPNCAALNSILKATEKALEYANSEIIARKETIMLLTDRIKDLTGKISISENDQYMQKQ